MSTQQQAMIMDTILALRRTLKRKADESDSDSSIDRPTNRGNKLKKRARFVRQGQLMSSMVPAAYKEIAEHAGFQRAIINRNPPLIDEDGYDIESDDDEEQVQEAIASAAEENPYSALRLEQILAPLTAVTDLPSHPTLSRPFTSKALTELVEQGRNLMQKENAALWKAKPLLTKLVGDHTWAPCGLMISPDDSDALLFTDTASFFNRPKNRLPAEAPVAASVNGVPNALEESTSTESGQRGASQNGSEAQPDARPSGNTERNKDSDEKAPDGETLPDAQADTVGEGEPEGRSSSTEKPKEDQQVNGGAGDRGGHAQAYGTSHNLQTAGGEDEEMADAPSAGHSTTAQQRGLTNPPVAADSPAAFPAAEGGAEELFIHPMFRLPAAAHADRDLGLPEAEAEEVRRLLLLYVQKQEEICRGTRRLYEGLLKADRYRKTVWRWAKAEAHCGPDRDMSDGEDWYDKEEWGLTEDLKKGEDEVEEDTAQTQKKTRNRK
ncbi:0bb7d382-1d30-4f37-9302-5227eda98a6a [Thermothielavioides terrestris]|uniref:0bb7d382-1d30-4f37-9302-5227eda98a6a n=1 Tax=Thermothielavioides terrestris TaxID=2587410 RepID=A0A3S4AZE0_9PEZI|nr:0bb7d382-1d30-4f37-9302-5227eda98a6a [Thermothielavioides terrestris]